jgi:hypothetical protein
MFFIKLNYSFIDFNSLSNILLISTIGVFPIIKILDKLSNFDEIKELLKEHELLP